MSYEPDNRTSRLIREAEETCSRAKHDVEELRSAIAEARATVAFERWWRFLDYDTNVINFLQNLDLDGSRKSAPH